MKTLLIIVALALVSCGYRDTVRRNCHLDSSGQACDTLFGYNEDEKEAANKRIMEVLQSSVESLYKLTNGSNCASTPQNENTTNNHIHIRLY